MVTLTLIPPIILHTMMYHSMLFLPYLQEHTRHDCCSPSLDQNNTPWSKPEHDDQRGGDEYGAVHQEAGGQEQLLKLDDLAYGLLLWTCDWYVRLTIATTGQKNAVPFSAMMTEPS